MYELTLLYGVCRHDYQGLGEIVDGGPLLGAGTFAMARGLAHNAEVANKHKRIYSFDLWLASGLGDYTADVGAATGSVFERFLEINRDYLDEIWPSPGSLLEMRWGGSPIEVLFVDLAKNLDLNAWVLRNWFTCLIPGKSVLIQQDYLHFAEWWIAVTMEYFRECFELIEFVYGGSAVYRCIKPISADRIEAFLRLSVADHASLMRSAISGAPESVAEVLKSGLAWLLMETDPAGAARALETVRPGIRHPDPAQNFSEIAESNSNMVWERLRQNKP
jgi:hypothetical protein